LLVQALGAYLIYLGEIGIQHYLLTPNQQDAGLNPLDRRVVSQFDVEAALRRHMAR
jgi:hypothetical protein